MIKSTNQFIKRPKPHYTELINVWVEDRDRIEIVKRMMIGNKDFKLEKLKLNPIYKETYNSIVKERESELAELDKSLLWSRHYQKKHFYEFAIPFSIYALVFIPYIFYKILYKRIYEHHVKTGYTADNLIPYNYWNIDFKNKELYPDSAIEIYFNMKKAEAKREEKVEELKAYNKKFVENISNRYVNDMVKRRVYLGFNDDED